MSQDNILLITTDQQRFDTIQALGNSSIYTPHLNYLYTQGTAYTCCYADCPICVPSRTTLMTGLRGYESGVVTNATHAQVMGQATARRATLPALLTDAGYQTRAMGKMHFDSVRACYGFESMTLPIDCLRSCEKQGLRPKTHGAMEQHDLAALPIRRSAASCSRNYWSTLPKPVRKPWKTDTSAHRPHLPGRAMWGSAGWASIITISITTYFINPSPPARASKRKRKKLWKL